MPRSVIIHRAGQEYGPYSIAELNQYVGSGHIALVDFARFEDESDWSSVEQIVNFPSVPEPISTTAPPVPETLSKKTVGESTGFVLSLASLTGCLSFLTIPAIILAHIQRARGVRTRKTVATMIIGYAMLILTALLVVIAALSPRLSDKKGSNADGSGFTIPSSLSVIEYNPDNPNPEGAGNMHGDTAFNSLEDVRRFFAASKQDGDGKPKTFPDQVSVLIGLEKSYLSQGHAFRVSPGPHQITGIFDQEGRTTTLVNSSGLLVSASDGQIPCFQIKDGDDIFYMSWSFLYNASHKRVADDLAPISTSGSSTSSSSNEPSLSSKLTRDEFKERLGLSFQMAGILQMPKAIFFKQVGQPDRKATVNGELYWYYSCSDGQVVLVVSAVALQGGLVNVTGSSDF